MHKIESRLVGLVVAFTGLLLPFVICWWIVAAFSLSGIYSFSENTVIIVALIGLGLGIVLDIFFLKSWVRKFYTANMYLLVLVYLVLSTIALAFCMGTPFGNLMLGTLAGLYIGRRFYHADKNEEEFARVAREASIFAACITAGESFPIGLLALREDGLIELLRITLGIDISAFTGSTGVAIIAAVCVAILFLQYWCTQTAARYAFRLGGPLA